MRKTKRVRIISFILSICILMSMGVWADTDSDIAEMEAARDAIDEKIKDYENTLTTLQNDEANAQAYKEALDSKVLALQERIDKARSDIELLNSSIKTLENELALSAQSYEDTISALKVRISALYKAGDVGTLEILLNSSSLYEFSLRSETLKSIANHDKDLLDKIQKYADETREDRNSLKGQKKKVAEIKKQSESDQEELEVAVDKQQELIGELQTAQANTADALAESQGDSEQYNNQISALIEQKRQEEEAEKKRQEEEAAKNPGDTGGSTPNTGGSTGGDGSGMSSGFSPRWPLPGYDTSWITGHYGNGHNGLDIAGAYGAQIVAAQSGQVISAEYHDSWGYNVLLYHNGTYSTRYAHMSTMAATPGQYVERGQVIGYVGSTGYSFGNHLHFEVYMDGYRVNPYGYL